MSASRPPVRRIFRPAADRRIELEHVKPLWRRIVVSNQWTLASLHNYVQWVVGWQDSHAHEFHVGSRVIAPEWWIREMEFDREAMHCVDERRVSVAAVASEIGMGGAFEYHYDMGDGWEHRLIVEAPPNAWADHDERASRNRLAPWKRQRNGFEKD